MRLGAWSKWQRKHSRAGQMQRNLRMRMRLQKKEYGMSFGQYCGTVLLNGIEQTGELPRYKNEDEFARKKQAIEFMKDFSSYPHNERIGRMADEELKDLIASRYE